MILIDPDIKKKIIIGVIIAAIGSMVSIIGAFAFTGFNETLVKKDYLSQNYYSKNDLKDFFPTKAELKQYYLTKDDVEKIYVKKVESIIAENEGQKKLMAEINDMKIVLNALKIRFDLQDIISKEDCPKPPCKRKGKDTEIVEATE